MDTVLGFLILGGLAFLAVSWPRLTSKSKVIRRIYRHVDEPLGARRFENDRRASRHRALSFISRDFANLLYPKTQFTGATVLPGARRMRRYIQIKWGTPPPWLQRRRIGNITIFVFWPRPWRVWHAQAVTLRWTSEANALGEGFGTLLARKVAQALILKSGSELDPHPAFDKGYFELRRSKPAKGVPVTVPFGEATDE